MNIILCGFMGSGKSSIGKRAARISGYKFVDLDRVIEENQKMPISEIFAKFGEEEFRKIETKMAKELAKGDMQIIATGGGTVLNPENVKVFNQLGGKILFLNVPVSALQERLKRDKRRPLLQRPDRREFIEALYEERYPRYRAAADITINAGAPLIVVARRIAELINRLQG